MNTNIKLELTIVQIFVIVLICVAIIYLVKQSRLNKYEKRLEDFSLFTNKDRGLSLFDGLYRFAWKIINSLAEHLKNAKILTNYAQKFEKFISFESRNELSGYTILSIKILVSLFIGFLDLVTMIFQYTSFNISLFILVLTCAFFIPDLYLSFQFKSKRKRVEEDLLKAIIIMNNAFKSGSNITQAVGIVKDELDGPISDEFKKIYIDINYGLSLDVVFNRFYERVKVDDVKYITSSLTLLNKTGGNIVNVFNLIEKTFFDKRKLKNELNSLTSASMFIYRLLLAMPFVLGIVISLLNPTYFMPLFNSGLGIVCLLLIIILYTFYIIIIRKLLKVKI